ncbi:kinesin-domain-containing protein [Backusella circina FSU 941]|nr:kinesin-domain-containing protein [Backusella circina FSU 941]
MKNMLIVNNTLVALRVKPPHSQQNTITFIKDEPSQIHFCNKRSFTFDFIYSPTTTQEQLYESSILPLLDQYTQGNNVTILAYGQTGSGKTYSMGTGLEPKDLDEQGIIHRFANTLFSRMNDLQLEGTVNSYQIYVSYLELYNEEINDLLLNASHPTVREDIHGNIYWSGLKEERIFSTQELLSQLLKGSNSRTTGSTEMNTYSSRSHAIFSVTLKQQQKENRLVSKFHFVDLAGSERLKRTHALGERQKEGIFINTGLLALGNVISALSDDEVRHVPYRDSKLTRLLQDSLGGNSHTLMLACVSPDTDDITETLNTLKYANRARNIQNRVEINRDEDDEVVFLRNQVSRLKLQLNMLRDVHQIKPEDTVRIELENVKSYALELSNELTKVKSERDHFILTHNDEEGGDEPSPLILKYLEEIQSLKWQVAQTQTQLDQSRLLTTSNNNTTHSLLSTDSLIKPKTSTSVHFFQHYPKSGTVTPKNTHSTGYQQRRRPSSYKRKVHAHRLNSVPFASRRKSGNKTPRSNSSSYNITSSTNNKIEYLLQLLTKEYYDEDNEETAKSTKQEQQQEQEQQQQDIKSYLKKDTPNDNIPDIPVSPLICTQSSDFDYDDDIEDDELEALKVPSWSDRTNYTADSIKRKSISVDSMWDDTDSSMTTPRHPQQQYLNNNDPSTLLQASKSRDDRRQNKNLLKMLHQIQADVLVKQELVGQLGKTEDEYAQMRETYEDKLKDLKGHLVENQQKTLSRPQSVMQLRENRQAQDVRSQYEIKIKRLLNELQELRQKNTTLTQQLKSSRIKSDQTLSKLRSDLDSLKLDKKNLLKARKLETEKNKDATTLLERELTQTKRREQQLLTDKKKWQDTQNSQKETIKKKSDELIHTSGQYRQLTTILRRTASEGVFLNEASLEKIMSGVVPKRPTSRAASAASYLTDISN